MIFDKSAKTTQWGKNNRWYWRNWLFTYKNVKLNSYSISYIKLNSRWIMDLNVKAKTKENIEVFPHDFELGNGFLKEQQKIHKLD